MIDQAFAKASNKKFTFKVIDTNENPTVFRADSMPKSLAAKDVQTFLEGRSTVKATGRAVYNDSASAGRSVDMSGSTVGRIVKAALSEEISEEITEKVGKATEKATA